MKFSSKKEDLLPIIQLVAHVAQTRAVHPVYSHLLIHLDGSTLTLTANDSECLMRASVPVSKEATGEMLLPAQKLQEICQRSPTDSTVSFSLSEDKAQIQAAKVRYSIATLAAGEFHMPELSKGPAISIPTKALHRLLEKTHCCVAATDFRNYLMGTLLDLTAEGVVAVATDTHRMGWARWSGEVPAEVQGRKAIVPKRSVEELLRLLTHALSQSPAKSKDKDKDKKDKADKADLGQVTITLSEQSASFQVGDLLLHTSLISGNYPDYQRVMPDESNGNTLVVDTEVLKSSLQRVQIIAGRGGATSWTLEEDKIKVAANNTAGEEAEEFIEGKFSGKAMHIGFNVDYQLSILENIDSDKVQFLLVSEADSIDIREPGRDDLRYVLMPLRL